MKFAPSKAAALLISIAILGVLSFGVYVKLDFGVILATWRKIDPLSIGAGVGFFFVFFAANTVRYQRLIFWTTAGRPLFARLYQITFVALFVAHGAPVAALAEVARVAMMRVMTGLTVGDSIRTIIYDRVMGLIGIAAAGLVTLPVQAWIGVDSAVIGLQAGLLGGTALATAVVLAACHHPALRGRARLGVASEMARTFVRAVTAAPRRLVLMAFLAGIYILICASVLWGLAQGMGLALGFTTLAVFTPVILLINNLPFLYVGWGGREAAVVATVGMSGDISPSEALALSVAYGLVFLIATLPGGVMLLRTRWRGQPDAAPGDS